MNSVFHRFFKYILKQASIVYRRGTHSKLFPLSLLILKHIFFKCCSWTTQCCKESSGGTGKKLMMLYYAFLNSEVIAISFYI